MAEVAKTKVAALQMEAKVADLPYNLNQAERLIEEAGSKGARVIALPEFFTSQIIYDERLFACSLPPENMALDMLTQKAAKYKAQIGGSYLEMRDGDVYNTYVLVEPNGTVHRHDKDLPTMVENAFYIGGKPGDDGLFETAERTVGIAMCWEQIRTQTARRLRGRADLLMTGSHWWSTPDLPILSKKRLAEYNQGNQHMMHVTPGHLAGLVGAPLLHASHAGPLTGKMLMVPGTGITTKSNLHLTGETQILDKEGNMIARRAPEEGVGIVVGDIEIERVEPRADIPDRFWIPPKLGFGKLLWWHQNACGKAMYKRAKKNGRLRIYGSNFPPHEVH